MADMWLMSGPSGAGKTTFAKEFAKEQNLKYYGVDDFYATFLADPIMHENEFEVWIAYFQAIHAAELRGESILVDTNAPTIVKRTEFLDWFPSFDHHLIFIHAPYALCAKNNKSRGRVIPNETMHEIYNSVQIPHKDEDARWKEIQVYTNVSNKQFRLVQSSC